MNEIVKITWLDAERLGGVRDASFVKEIEPVELDIVGFLVFRDEKKTIIVQEKCDESKQVRDTTIIPECSIIKFVVIKEEGGT